VEEHGRELNDDDCEEEKYEDDTDRLEMKVLFRNNDLKQTSRNVCKKRIIRYLDETNVS
jgi:hypothetical protein